MRLGRGRLFLLGWSFETEKAHIAADGLLHRVHVAVLFLERDRHVAVLARLEVVEALLAPAFGEESEHDNCRDALLQDELPEMACGAFERALGGDVVLVGTAEPDVRCVDVVAACGRLG